MPDLASLVQRVALESLAPEGRADVLRSLRPALRQLRQDYGASRDPSFHLSTARAAYVFAYHPHHVLLSGMAAAAAGPQLLGLEDDVARITVLGAGPAPEVVGLARYAATSLPQLRCIEVLCIDREPGWEETRTTTLNRTLPHVWDGEVVIESREVDLAAAEGLTSIGDALAGSDLVLAQTLLTALPNPLGEGQLLHHLLSRLGPRTRLLVSDIRLDRDRGRTPAELDAPADAVSLLSSEPKLAAAGPHPELAEHLFADEDGLRPRRHVNCWVRLLARPGAVTGGPATTVVLTPSQRAATEVFDRFLTGDERVSVLRGPAGTGKTTLFPELIARAARHDLPVTLLAPTGQAARRLEDGAGRAGATIHSTIYRFRDHESEGVDDAPTARFVPAEPPAGRALYVIDEASLIGDEPDRASHGPREVRFHEGRLLSDLLTYALAHPDSKVVFVGDPAQLPPVGEDLTPALEPGELRQRTDADVSVAELHESVRQDAALVRYATELRTWPASDRSAAVPAYRPDPEAGLCEIRRSDVPVWLVEAIGAGEGVVVAARNTDVRAWNRTVRERLGRPRDVAVGDRLVVTRTDPVTRLLNGDELRVASVGSVETVRVANETVSLRSVEVGHQEAGIGEVVTPVLLVEDLLDSAPRDEHARVTQALFVDFIVRRELRPGDQGFAEAYSADPRAHALRATYAYARTCHRAQGGEWDHVVVDATGSRFLGRNRRRWLYTAVTRARRAIWVTGLQTLGTYDEGRLAEEATEALRDVGLDVVAVRELQHGVKLTVDDDREQVTIDLYRKNGLPSTAHRVGGPNPTFTQLALDTLRGWITEAGRVARPPAPELDAVIAELNASATTAGWDLATWSPADYQVTLQLTSLGRSGWCTYHHTAAGCLTSKVTSGGDALDLIAAVDTMVEEVRT